MNSEVINIANKFTQFSDLWAPKIIAQMNDYHFKLVKFLGDFVWHSHEKTDEVFIVIDGSMAIDFRDRRVRLNKGEMYVVPKGMEHKSFAERECKIMLVEPAGTINTGDTISDATAQDGVWI